MAIYTRTALKAGLEIMVSGKIADSDQSTIINKAVRDIAAEMDIRSFKRKAALSPNLLDDVYEYSCPSDLKGNKIVDIRPQIKRGRFDDWRLTTEEEFDRLKDDSRVDSYGDPIELNRSQWLGQSLVAISNDDMVRKLLISRPIDDTETVVDSLDSVGSWAGYGDGENLTADNDDYVKGNASINWDISAVGGTTAGIYNASLSTFDISEYLTEGSVFVWVHISSITNLTNFIIRIGSSASAYYTVTVTTNNEGVSFYAGWNLLRFDLSGKTTVGTPDDDAFGYCAIFMTKAGAKISETDYRFDNIMLKVGEHYNVIYYSRYGWVSAAGVYLENATADTDYVNLETDEVRLLETKIAEVAEQFLGNDSRADRYFKLYEKQKADYKRDNYSEALVPITKYHNI